MDSDFGAWSFGDNWSPAGAWSFDGEYGNFGASGNFGATTWDNNGDYTADPGQATDPDVCLNSSDGTPGPNIIPESIVKVLTPGAVTPGLITDGAITEGAVAPGDITPGAIEDGAIDYSALVVPSPVVYGATKVFVALLPNGTPIAL